MTSVSTSILSAAFDDIHTENENLRSRLAAAEDRILYLLRNDLNNLITESKSQRATKLNKENAHVAKTKSSSPQEQVSKTESITVNFTSQRYENRDCITIPKVVLKGMVKVLQESIMEAEMEKKLLLIESTYLKQNGLQLKRKLMHITEGVLIYKERNQSIALRFLLLFLRRVNSKVMKLSVKQWLDYLQRQKREQLPSCFNSTSFTCEDHLRDDEHQITKALSLINQHLRRNCLFTAFKRIKLQSFRMRQEQVSYLTNRVRMLESSLRNMKDSYKTLDLKMNTLRVKLLQKIYVQKTTRGKARAFNILRINRVCQIFAEKNVLLRDHYAKQNTLMKLKDHMKERVTWRKFVVRLLEKKTIWQKRSAVTKWQITLLNTKIDKSLQLKDKYRSIAMRSKTYSKQAFKRLLTLKYKKVLLTSFARWKRLTIKLRIEEDSISKDDPFHLPETIFLKIQSTQNIFQGIDSLKKGIIKPRKTKSIYLKYFFDRWKFLLSFKHRLKRILRVKYCCQKTMLAKAFFRLVKHSDCIQLIQLFTRESNRQRVSMKARENHAISVAKDKVEALKIVVSKCRLLQSLCAWKVHIVKLNRSKALLKWTCRRKAYRLVRYSFRIWRHDLESEQQYTIPSFQLQRSGQSKHRLAKIKFSGIRTISKLLVYQWLIFARQRLFKTKIAFLKWRSHAGFNLFDQVDIFRNLKRRSTAIASISSARSYRELLFELQANSTNLINGCLKFYPVGICSLKSGLSEDSQEIPDIVNYVARNDHAVLSIEGFKQNLLCKVPASDFEFIHKTMYRDLLHSKDVALAVPVHNAENAVVGVLASSNIGYSCKLKFLLCMITEILLGLSGLLSAKLIHFGIDTIYHERETVLLKKLENLESERYGESNRILDKMKKANEDLSRLQEQYRRRENCEEQLKAARKIIKNWDIEFLQNAQIN